MSMNENMETELTPENFEAIMKEQQEQRMSMLKSKEMPAVRSLHETLAVLSHEELTDIAFNLNATDDENLPDENLRSMLVTAIQEFTKHWFTTIVEDQMALFDFIVEHGGATTEIRSEDGRLDYLRGIGVLFCGMSAAEDKLAWYMADEVLEEYKKLKNDAFEGIVRQNTEVMQLAAGVVFYYGAVDYDKLFAMIKEYTDDDEMEFSSFMGVIYNGSEWCPTVVADKHDLYHSEVLDLDKLRSEQQQRDLDYLELPYDRVYDAGDENHIESTPEYRKLAQHMMKEFKLDVLQAADLLRNVNAIIQNSYGMNDVLGFLAGNIEIKSKETAQSLAMLVAEYSNTLPMWVLKGHTPVEVQGNRKPVRRASAKIGRNDPCPCGSGKKYKNCCLQMTN